MELDDKSFRQKADETFAWIDQVLEGSGADVEVTETGGGVLEVEFADGSKLVVNRHAVAREIWVAARSGGFHFRFDGAEWRDTRSGESLPDTLSRLVSDQAGEVFKLSR